MPEKINPQDMMVWITQGPITDHTLENLGESDRGVALYRRTLLDEIARAAYAFPERDGTEIPLAGAAQS
jgi:hypothetical protein